MRRLGVLAAVLLVLLPSSGGAANKAARAGVYTGYGFDACTAPSTAALNAWSASPYRALGMDSAGRRRAMAPEATRERRDLDHRLKAGAEVFSSVAIPMAACDRFGKVRVANAAFLEFLGCAGDAGGLELRDSALPEVYPTLFEDLEKVANERRPLKRVIYLNEGGERVVEAAIVLNAAPNSAEVTAGEIFLVLHPLRALLS